MNKQTVTINLEVSEKMKWCIDIANRPDNDLSGSVHHLLARGLKSIMVEQHGNCPLNPRFLLSYHSPAAVVELFREWHDATCTKLGLEGPLGNRYRFVEVPENSRLAKFPEGSKHYAPGKATYVVLSEHLAFNESGEIAQKL